MEDVNEAEDREVVVVFGDAGCAVMQAVAGLGAAASAAATAGRMEGMSSGCRLGLGGWGGPAVTWRPGGPIWFGSGGGGRRGAVAFSFWAWLGRGPAMCEAVGVGVRGGEQYARAAFGSRGGWAWVLWGGRGACVGATGPAGRAAGRGAPLVGCVRVVERGRW